MKKVRFAILLWALQAGTALGEQNTVEVPAVDAGLGHCSATFTVTDKDKKPIYNAQINVVIRFGALGLHKNDLQVGTNSEGRARVSGLPEKTKKPLEFRVGGDPSSKTIKHNPASKCEAAFDVILDQ